VQYATSLKKQGKRAFTTTAIHSELLAQLWRINSAEGWMVRSEQRDHWRALHKELLGIIVPF